MKRRKFITLGLLGIGALATGRLPKMPEPPVTWGLVPTGNFIVVDGGTLDLGIIRDSVLNSTNDFEMFAETFESVAASPSLWVTSTVG